MPKPIYYSPLLTTLTVAQKKKIEEHLDNHRETLLTKFPIIPTQDLLEKEYENLVAKAQQCPAATVIGGDSLACMHHPLAVSYLAHVLAATRHLTPDPVGIVDKILDTMNLRDAYWLTTILFLGTVYKVPTESIEILASKDVDIVRLWNEIQGEHQVKGVRKKS